MKKDRFTRNLHRREAKSRRRRQRKAAQTAAAAAIATGAIALTGGTAAGTGSGSGVDEGLIVFDSTRDQFTLDAWTVDPGNANPESTATARSQSIFQDGQPVFSPNGQEIAYMSTRVDPNFPTALGAQVWVQPLTDPSQAHPVTSTPGNDASSLISWSDDGSEIAFSKGIVGPFGGTRDIWAADVLTLPDGLGNNERQVTDDPADDVNPSWDPSGGYIAFDSRRDNGDGGTDSDIWRVDDTGTESNPVDIAPYPDTNENEADYSPGGYLILFTSDKNQATNRDVYVKPASTSTTNWRLTTALTAEFTPRFSPLLIRFTYSSTRQSAANQDIYTQYLLPDTNSNAAVRRITTNAAADQHPDWQGVPGAGGGCHVENHAAKEDSLVDEALANNASPLSAIVNNQQPSSSSYGDYNAGSSDNAGGVSSDCGPEGGATSDGGSGGGSHSDGGSSD